MAPDRIYAGILGTQLGELLFGSLPIFNLYLEIQNRCLGGKGNLIDVLVFHAFQKFPHLGGIKHGFNPQVSYPPWQPDCQSISPFLHPCIW